MATQKRALNSPTSPSPPRSHTFSSAHSTVRSPPLVGGLLVSHPATPPPPQSSPDLLTTESESSHSPDLFPFRYTSDMDSDFKRIDAETLEAVTQLRNRSSQSNTEVLVSNSPPPTPTRDRRFWVVFRGKTPGLYDESYVLSFGNVFAHSRNYSKLMVIMQTQGFSDAFQRTYPDRPSAVAAWNAYSRDGTYPEYGKSPWVVFIGRRPGVFEKV